jgi:hypothetical protein
MRRALLALALVVLPALAAAALPDGTPLFTWTLPTQQTDGTAIPATGPQALASVRIYIDGTLKKTIATPATTWQTAVGDIGAGSHNATATAVNVAGQESAKSSPLVFIVPAPAPLAPSGLTVQ